MSFVLSVVMLDVVRLSVVMVSVAAPFEHGFAFMHRNNDSRETG
jgi:hypothetical protein